MRISILLFAILAPSFALADARCVTLEKSVLANKCEECSEVTVHELRPPSEQAAGLFSGTSRTVRLDANARVTLEGTQSWVIGEIKVCK